MWISGKEKKKKKETRQHVSAQRGVIESLEMNPFSTHTHVQTHTHTHIHYAPPEPPSLPPSPHSRGCRSEKLNFSDEKLFPAPIPLLPLSPPIHSLIYSLIYELLIYALREKLTVVQSSVRAAATLTIDDHHRGTGMSHTHTHTHDTMHSLQRESRTGAAYQLVLK